MIAVLLFLLLVSSGSVFAAAKFEKTYEETVPLTIFCMVEFVFLFGLVDQLRLGIYALCAICTGLYIWTVWFAHKNKMEKELVSRLLTPAFFMFIGLLTVYTFCIYGIKIGSAADEYSFWANSVKKMFTLNALPCVKEALLEHAEYPPGISVFHLILQVLQGTYTEWLLYMSKMVYTLAMFLPFLKGLRHRSVVQNVLLMAVIFSCGTTFHRMVHVQLLVDFLLGLTFAYGMAWVIAPMGKSERYDAFAVANIVMAANMLILIKSAGALLAGFLLLALAICVLLSYKKDLRNAVRSDRKKSLAFVATCLIPWITQGLWKLRYTREINNIAFDAGKYDLREFLLILMGKTDGGYRKDVVKNFLQFLYEEKWQSGVLNLTNPQWWCVLFAILFLVWFAWQKRGGTIRGAGMYVLMGGLPIYVVGLLASYMYTFVEGEGLALAGIQRYLGIYYFALLLTALFLFLRGIARFQWDEKAVCAVCLLSMCCVSLPHVFGAVSREELRISLGMRAPVEETANELREHLQTVVPEYRQEELIMVIDESKGTAHDLAYLLWPEYRLLWQSCFEETPTKGYGMGVRIVPAAEFRDYVEECGASYIAVVALDDQFARTYGDSFDVPLEEGQIFRVSEGTEVFELIGN